jgi:MoaA/NifB/PqqE/SkfB family radical SAM enzyme
MLLDSSRFLTPEVVLTELLMTTAENVQRVPALNDLSFLWLEITARCNLFCSHCYAESGVHGAVHGDMSFADWTCVIDEAAGLGCRSIQFIGGEPTMHPQLDDLVDHANHRGFAFIEVFTNATRLGQKLLGCFQRAGVRTEQKASGEYLNRFLGEIG